MSLPSSTSFHRFPNISFRVLFSKPLRLFSFLNGGNQVSKPHKTTDKIIVMFILILK
jgi:hypothetical protein